MGNVFNEIGHLEQYKNLLYHYKNDGFSKKDGFNTLKGLKKEQLEILNDLSNEFNRIFVGVILEKLTILENGKKDERQFTNSQLGNILQTSRQTINNWSKNQGLVNVGTEEKRLFKESDCRCPVFPTR